MALLVFPPAAVFRECLHAHIALVHFIRGIFAAAWRTMVDVPMGDHRLFVAEELQFYRKYQILLCYIKQCPLNGIKDQKKQLYLIAIDALDIVLRLQRVQHIDAEAVNVVMVDQRMVHVVVVLAIVRLHAHFRLCQLDLIVDLKKHVGMPKINDFVSFLLQYLNALDIESRNMPIFTRALVLQQFLATLICVRECPHARV